MAATRKRPARGLVLPLVLTFVLTLLVGACGGGADEAAPAVDSAGALDLDRIGAVLLERLDLQPGERVLLVGTRGRFDGLATALRDGVRAAGALDLGLWIAGEGPGPEPTDFTGRLAAAGDDLLPVLREVDAGVMLPGATTSHPVYAGLQDVLREGRGRTVHFHWAGAYALDGTERAVDGEVDAFYQSVLVETDYAGLAAAQRAFEEAMRGAEVRVTTPAGTDLSFRIGDRPLTRQDGDASAARAAEARNLIDREVELPAGAIRVAPLEESVGGRIAFPPTVWGGTRVEGLVVTFREGVAVAVEAETGVEAARAEMEANAPAGEAFREFALGFNPLLAVPEVERPWIPYYGYGAGVVRLSLGDNSELGGAVGGGYVRWNFFTDATVAVGGDVWVRDGRLVR